MKDLPHTQAIRQPQTPSNKSVVSPPFSSAHAQEGADETPSVPRMSSGIHSSHRPFTRGATLHLQDAELRRPDSLALAGPLQIKAIDKDDSMAVETGLRGERRYYI